MTSTEPTYDDVGRARKAYADTLYGPGGGHEVALDAALSAVLPAHDRRVRAEALREAADEVRAMGIAGENDGLPWTPGDAGTEVYNEAIRDAWETIRARADAEEGK